MFYIYFLTQNYYCNSLEIRVASNSFVSPTNKGANGVLARGIFL